MRGALAAACVVLATTSGCRQQRSSAEPADAAAAKTTEEVLATVLPGVVLLVNRHADGAIGFGSGIVVDDDGLVLTNLHVVADGESLGGLLYDPKRVSYIPQDGGLARYLFENDSAVVPARLVRGDPVLDLALVKLRTSTKGVKLGFRATAVKQGERVMAVGHPGETVWSFTSGVVSSLHQGMIQTDAAINRGNSGGPLVDGDGKVVGINTSKLIGDMHGIGFARPGELAQPIIAGQAKQVTLDRTSPEATVRTCMHAMEQGSETLLECNDEDAFYEAIMDKLRRKLKRLNLTGAAKADFEQRIMGVSKEEVIGTMRASQLAMLRGEDPAAPARALNDKLEAQPLLDGAAESYKKTFARKKDAVSMRDALESPDGGVARAARELDEAVYMRTGIKIDRKNARQRLDVLKMGIRIERSHQVDDAHAWVAITGRNTDASEYRQALYLTKKPDGWRMVGWPTAAAEKTRPSDFPLTFSDYEEDIERQVSYEILLFKPASKEGGAGSALKKKR
ncbi:MAG: trypsin-like peptidase domain-containing protein [Labilithrix sp.]|nr:trypsin-like peptidase domain-containing protein [Labilithrix sp.]MCW5814316.1 trypsin-like peptidase domain-containing protein [Labilithrix sp.]